MIPALRANLETIISVTAAGLSAGEFSATISCRINLVAYLCNIQFDVYIYIYTQHFCIFLYYTVVYSMTSIKQTCFWNFFVQFISKSPDNYIILGITGIPGPLMKDRPVLVTNTSSLPSGGSTLPGNEDRKFAALFLKIGLLIVPKRILILEATIDFLDQTCC